MDFSSKHLSLLFLITLFFSLQIHGRENFSKFTHVVNNNNAKDTELPKPNKVEPQSQSKQQEEEPNITPETQNGYGLYGHDSTTQLTPTTTIPNNNNDNSNNDKYYYTDKEYEDLQQQDMIDTSLLANGYTTPISNTHNNYYNQQQQDNNVYIPDNQYNTEQQQQYNAENRYNTEQRQYSGGNTGKQGMSDTRYLENGRYYYDLNSEKNYRSGYYDNKVYYGNNENSYEFRKPSQNGYP